MTLRLATLPPAGTKSVDPFTFEVLRHRLWQINDEQGRITARISGSPAIYQANDFNASIMTPQGDSLYVGIYVTVLGTAISRVVKSVLERYAENPGIHPGDMFATNDPWAGTLHMNDTVVVSPVFHKGELVCWTGVSMHEMDVGGPVPGGFVVGSQDVYGEAPLIPPVKIVERGQFRKDIEELFLRNTRTRVMNALNIRARIASQNVTQRRLEEILERYGVDAFLAVQQQLVDSTATVLRERLRELPDGQWRARTYIDHDGHQNKLYPIQVELTKKGDRLAFDFHGTAPQAPGLINCPYSGLEGAVVGALFSMLFYELPWCGAVVQEIATIVTEEGTVNNASYPAALSSATVAASWVTMNVCTSVIGKMFACSEKYKAEAQAVSAPGWNGTVLAGVSQDGLPVADVLMDASAGGMGARGTGDGVDTGGFLLGLGMAIGNVEATERHYPVLFLSRRQRDESGGHGKYRGGHGMELMLTLHDSPMPMQMVNFAHGVALPGAEGLYGGLPSSVMVSLAVRDSNVKAVLASGKVPVRPDEVEGTLEVRPAKGLGILGLDDVYVSIMGAGGGYGDPVTRDPNLVAADVRRGLVSPARAAQTYGVVLAGAGVDFAATEDRRAEIRRVRLANARPFSAWQIAKEG